MLKEQGNALGDAISAMAQYCEDEKDFAELTHMVIMQVNHGARAIGGGGSRVEGTNQPNSDLDLMLIRPDLDFVDHLEGSVHLGEYRKSSKGVEDGWLDFTKINPNLLLVLYNRETIHLLRKTKWFWTDDQSSLNRLNDIVHSHPVIGLFKILAQGGRIWSTNTEQ